MAKARTHYKNLRYGPANLDSIEWLKMYNIAYQILSHPESHGAIVGWSTNTKTGFTSKRHHPERLTFATAIRYSDDDTQQRT